MTAKENIDEISYLEQIAKLNQEKWRGLGAYLFFVELGTNYSFNSADNTITFDWLLVD